MVSIAISFEIICYMNLLHILIILILKMIQVLNIGILKLKLKINYYKSIYF